MTASSTVRTPTSAPQSKATDVSLQFELRSNPKPRSESERSAILANPGFGMHFTDHMAVATWTAADGWHDSAFNMGWDTASSTSAAQVAFRSSAVCPR